jgi:hypothetical protein
VEYRTSGRWEAEIGRVADECTRAAREAAGAAARPAVVFDIDETLLSNWPYLTQYDFARVPSLFAPWAERSESPANEAVRRFYETMRDAGVATFVITGRREALRKATITNLERQGISGWAGIAFRPVDDHETSIVPFKVRRACPHRVERLHDRGQHRGSGQRPRGRTCAARVQASESRVFHPLTRGRRGLRLARSGRTGHGET